MIVICIFSLPVVLISKESLRTPSTL